MRSLPRSLALATTITLIASSVLAQGPPPSDELQWSLGLGVISSPRPYVDADNETQVIPLVELSYKRFYIRGISTGFHLVDSDTFELDLEARVQFAGLEEDDSPFLEGMEDRDETVELGIVASRSFGQWELQGSVHADALGRSDGVSARVTLGWSKIFGRGKAGIFPSVGLVWQNGDLIDYYAGVRPEEARPGRPAYTADSAINAEAGVRYFYRFTPRVSALVLIQGEHLAGEFEDSPIIEDSWGYFALAGLTYTF